MRVVIAPWFRFSELAQRLAALGWDGGSAVGYPPLVPGEPEIARWQKGTDTMTYSCNPAVWLRLLETDAAIPDGVLAALPRLTTSAIEDLLGSSDDDRLVLGLLAAQALHLTSALPGVNLAQRHDRPVVSNLARSVAARLAGGRNL